MTDDGSLLLRAILESPAEDAPRLILADYLDALPTVRVPCQQCDGDGKHRHLTVLGSGKEIRSSTIVTCSSCNGTGTAAIDTANADRAESIRGAIEQLRLKSSGMLCHIPDPTRPRPYDVEELPYHCLPRCLLCRSIHLSNRLPELLSRYEFTWASPLGDIGFQANSTWVPECEWEFTRGFVSAISLSLADFMDEARTAAIFARHPITKVRLTDVRCWNSGNHRWGWSVQAADRVYGNEPNWVLPDELFSLLNTADCVMTGNVNRRWWATDQKAFSALSLAAVNYGRSLAKLLPLTSLPTGV